MNKKLIDQLFIESNEIVVDSSILIAYFMKEKPMIISLLDKHVFDEDSSIILYTHHLMKAEIYYIICRKKDNKKAADVLNKMDKIFNVVSEKWLCEVAGQIKCSFPISLADCFSISLGILQNCPVLFLEEEELSKKIINDINNKFDAQVKIIT